MVDFADQNSDQSDGPRYLTKKCPHCYEYLPLRANVCMGCQKKVGDVDKLGFAQKPVDLMGYLIALAAIVTFSVFMWWGFFRE